MLTSSDGRPESGGGLGPTRRVKEVRYADTNNAYSVLLNGSGSVKLYKWVRGKRSTVATGSYTVATPNALKVKLSGTGITVWVDGSQKIHP